VSQEAVLSRARLKPLFIGLALAALAVGILYLSARPDELKRQFFGKWRARDVLIALALVWLSGGFIANAISTKLRSYYVLASIQIAGIWILFEILGATSLINYPRLFKREIADVLGAKAIPNADISGTTYPDTAARWGLGGPPMPFHYKTDRRGYRNDVDRDSADVYLLGDSLLVAALVPFPETLTAQLEKKLDRPVVNISLIGIGVQRERDMLRDANLPLEGRLVIHEVFQGNDLLDSEKYRSGGHGEQFSLEDRLLSPNVALILQRITDPVDPAAQTRSCTIDDTLHTFLWAKESFVGREQEVPHVLQALAETKAMVESKGGTYAVIMVPQNLRVLGPICRFPPKSDLVDYAAHDGPLPDALLAWSQKTGVPYLDLTAALRESAKAKRIPWFPTDTHWNAVGQGVAAEQIASWSAVREWAEKHPRASKEP
jgi:hypothetical protein